MEMITKVLTANALLTAFAVVGIVMWLSNMLSAKLTMGRVHGSAIGASSPVIALSIATGVFKAVMVMVGTPLVAGLIGLNNPRSAMVFGGLMGTVSGVSGGLAATDRRLVPYGALTATFHTGLGCLVAPSILYLIVRAIVGG